MLIEIIAALLLGCIIGTFTGLFPGIHINLIAAILISSLAFFPTSNPILLIIFIVSMSITHTFLDFIPSIFLGAPEEDSFLSVLPGHQLLQKGQGFKAIILTLYGSLAALAIILIFTPVFLYALPTLQKTITPILPFLLIFASFYLIFREDYFLTSLTVFLLAGILGYLTLNLPVEQPLLPLLTGLFGTSTLLVSIKNKTKIPKQTLTPLKKIKLPKKQLFLSSIAAALTAPLSSFMPGMGSGHAAVLASEIKEHKTEDFLFLLGAINTIVMALSFITLFSLSRTRTGAAAAIKQIIQTLTTPDLIIILTTIFVSGISAFFIGIKIAKLFSQKITKVKYSYLSLTIISILVLINFIFTNFLGLIVLTTATALGIFCILSKSRRINLMGSLLIPTIIFYLA
jgi:putative membrane protein